MTNIVARDYSNTQLALIKNTIASDCSAPEFDLFIEMAKRHGLDPFKRQVYAIVTNKDRPEKRQLVVVTGIDGYRSIAGRHGDYRPDENEPDYEFDQEAKNPDTNPLGLVKAVVTVHKQDKQGVWHPVKGVAYWDEFAPLNEVWEWNQEQGKKVPSGKYALAKGKDNWRRMGRLMLAKCAEAQALRKGWSEELGGLYVHEEMDKATVDLSPSEYAEVAESEERMKRIAGSETVPLIFSGQTGIELVPLGQVGDRVAAFVRENSPAAVEWFRSASAHGLRIYWAKNPSEALEVKKLIEAKVAQEVAA